MEMNSNTFEYEKPILTLLVIPENVVQGESAGQEANNLGTIDGSEQQLVEDDDLN